MKNQFVGREFPVANLDWAAAFSTGPTFFFLNQFRHGDPFPILA